MSDPADGRRLHLVPHVSVGEDEGQTALLIDGVVQSILVDDGPLGPGYWPLMLPDVRPRAALILGLGGGTLAHLLVRRFPGVRVTGVENDPAVVRLAQSAFRVSAEIAEIVEADALAFVFEATGPFDYVAVDLFAAGQIPRRAFQKPFLKRVKELLTPGGVAAFNFFKDRRAPARLRRLESIFPRVEIRQSRENFVAMCRAR
jgi:spermidine synthase